MAWGTAISLGQHPRAILERVYPLSGYCVGIGGAYCLKISLCVEWLYGIVNSYNFPRFLHPRVAGDFILSKKLVCIALQGCAFSEALWGVRESYAVIVVNSTFLDAV